MMVAEEISFHNELEDTDYTVTDDGEPDLSNVWVMNGNTGWGDT